MLLSLFPESVPKSVSCTGDATDVLRVACWWVIWNLLQTVTGYKNFSSFLECLDVMKLPSHHKYLSEMCIFFNIIYFGIDLEFVWFNDLIIFLFSFNLYFDCIEQTERCWVKQLLKGNTNKISKKQWLAKTLLIISIHSYFQGRIKQMGWWELVRMKG